ncbi:MAG: hypothetical protein AAGA10_23995 [Bacteroidota bacterium]
MYRWTEKRTKLFLALFFAYISSSAQIAFSRYIGEENTDIQIPRIDIFNSSPTTMEVSGYYIATRRYVFQIPPNTYLPALQSLSFGPPIESDQENYFSLGELLKTQKVTQGRDPGNYIVLFKEDFSLIDAFYFSHERQVDFLPFQEMIANQEGDGKLLLIPDESNSKWKHLRTMDGKIDPALSFVQINGDWRISSRSKNMLPATTFTSCQAQFFDDVVRVQWQVLDEQECYNYLIERSADGIYFRQIGTVPALGQAADYAYSFQDVNIKSDVQYYYRIRNVDKFGFEVFSPLAAVQTGRTRDRFQMEVLDVGKSVNIRFTSTQNQEIRIKLMDEEFREIDILYFGAVEAGKDNLIEYLNQLAIGKYYLIAQTERQRVYEEVIVE